MAEVQARTARSRSTTAWQPDDKAFVHFDDKWYMCTLIEKQGRAWTVTWKNGDEEPKMMHEHYLKHDAPTEEVEEAPTQLPRPRKRAKTAPSTHDCSIDQVVREPRPAQRSPKRAKPTANGLVGSTVAKKFPGLGKDLWEGKVIQGPDAKGRFCVYWLRDDSHTWHTRSALEKILTRRGGRPPAAAKIGSRKPRPAPGRRSRRRLE